jgi:hypothetical protein
MATPWYYPPIRRRFTVAANQSGAAETVPYRGRASIQSCRNILLEQPRLIQGNQLSGLTDAEPGLSHLSSSLSDQLKHAALGDAVPPANLGSGRPVYILSDQAIDRLSLQPPASRSAQTGPQDKRYVSLCRPYLCGSKGALGCPGTRCRRAAHRSVP